MLSSYTTDILHLLSETCTDYILEGISEEYSVHLVEDLSSVR